MKELTIRERPDLENPIMVLGFTGWMDGGHVSTGTIQHLSEALGARSLGDIDSLEFQILNFPVATMPVNIYVEGEEARVSAISPMEFSAIFRPHVEIRDGIIEELRYPRNELLYTKDPDLILMHGEEPHIRWGAYCDCVLQVAQEFGVAEMYFVGSVSSPIPHTREPRVHCSAASHELKEKPEAADAQFTDYSGPGSIVNLISMRSLECGIAMMNLVVEVPHYPFLDMPGYPKSIIRIMSVLGELTGLATDLSGLRRSADQAEAQLQRLMDENSEFKRLVERLEASHDYEEYEADEDLLRRLIDGIDLKGDRGEE